MSGVTYRRGLGRRPQCDQHAQANNKAHRSSSDIGRTLPKIGLVRSPTNPRKSLTLRRSTFWPPAQFQGRAQLLAVIGRTSPYGSCKIRGRAKLSGNAYGNIRGVSSLDRHCDLMGDFHEPIAEMLMVWIEISDVSFE
jgi:hypothetical protein